jgi:hypothetical protein
VILAAASPSLAALSGLWRCRLPGFLGPKDWRQNGKEENQQYQQGDTRQGILHGEERERPANHAMSPGLLGKAGAFFGGFCEEAQ